MIFKRLPLTFIQPIQVREHLIKSREVLLLMLEKDGKRAVAEVSPLENFSEEYIDQTAHNIQSLSLDNIKTDIDNFLNQKSNYDSFCKNDFLSYDFSKWTKYPSLQWGLCCLFSSFYRKTNTTGKIYFQGLLQGSIQEILNKAKHIEKENFLYAKVKVGRRPHEQKMLKELLDQTENLKFRLDANASLTAREACDLVFDLSRERIDYFEEPLINLSELIDYYATSKVPYAIDENLEDYSESTMRISTEGLKALILKPTLIGDFYKIEKTISQVHKLEPQVKLIVSSTYESQLGIKNLCRLAHTLAPMEHHGLDTWNVFLEQICELNVHQNTISFDSDDTLLGPLYVC